MMNVPEVAAAANAPKCRLCLDAATQNIKLLVDDGGHEDRGLADFVRKIATLISRAEQTHIYSMTAKSLHNAFSCGMTTTLMTQLHSYIDKPVDQEAWGALLKLFSIARAAWLTLPSATVEWNQRKKEWKVEWPQRPRLAVDNCGELYWMLQTRGVRESLIADRTMSGNFKSVQAALNLVSLALVVATNVRPRDADAAIGEEAVCQRVSGVHAELAAMQAGGRLPGGPHPRLRLEMRAVEATMSFVSSQHAEIFTLHTAPLKEGAETQRLSALRSRLASGQIGVMELPTGGLLALVAVHPPPQPGGAFVLSCFTVSGATAGVSGVSGVPGVPGVSGVPTPTSAQDVLDGARKPPARPLAPIEFQLPSVDCEVTRHVEREIASMPQICKYRFSAAGGRGGTESTAAVAGPFRGAAKPPLPLPMQLTKGEHERLRDYQLEAVASVVDGGEVQAGLVVLPCGAGKTLTGIAIACRVGQSVVIVCPHLGSVEQWRKQLISETGISPARIVRITSKHTDRLPGTLSDQGNYLNLFGGNGAVLLTTYAMLGSGKATKHDDTTPLGEACKRAWGLLLLDEVHMAPANTYQRCMSRVKARCVVGLTATLLREDKGIDAIPRLIGPVLFEAHAKDLERAGHLAPAECCEVSCDLPSAFGQDYRAAADSGTHSGHKHAHLVAAFNPSKLRCAAALTSFHVQRREKTIVFCERPAALKWFARNVPIEWEDQNGIMGRTGERCTGLPYLDGTVAQGRREAILESFRQPGGVPAICLSSVGDEAIDLPNAQVAIQFSSAHGSRRQEAQRLGRLLRVNPDRAARESAPEALFYSLISESTMEVEEAGKRQEYLRTQGYRIVKARLGTPASAALNASTAAGQRVLCILPEGPMPGQSEEQKQMADVLAERLGGPEGERELLTALRAARGDEGESSGVASMSESDDVQAAT